MTLDEYHSVSLDWMGKRFYVLSRFHNLGLLSEMDRELETSRLDRLLERELTLVTQVIVL